MFFQRIANLLGMPESDLLWWANETRIWATAIAAVAAVVTFVASYAQIRLQATISTEKDRAFSEYKLSTETEAANSRERAAQLDLEAKRLAIDQEKMRHANISLQKSLEKERIERLALEKRVGPRRLFSEDADKIKNALKSAGALRIKLTTYSDVETASYARQIEAALRDAGVSVERGGVIMSSGGKYTGVLLEEGAPDLVFEALRAGGVDVQVMPSKKNDMLGTGGDVKVLFVGIKPV